MGILWQYHRDEPTLTYAGALNYFPGNSALFKFKPKIRDLTGNDGRKAVQIMVQLNSLSTF